MLRETMCSLFEIEIINLKFSACVGAVVVFQVPEGKVLPFGKINSLAALVNAVRSLCNDNAIMQETVVRARVVQVR